MNKTELTNQNKLLKYANACLLEEIKELKEKNTSLKREIEQMDSELAGESW
jgi:hypothetical protein